MMRNILTTKTIYYFLIALLTLAVGHNDAIAATITITANTNWSVISPAPTASDNIIITNSAVLTVNVGTAVCANIQIASGSSNGSTGTLFFNSGSQVTVSGSVTLGDKRAGILDMTNGGKLICQSLVTENPWGTSFTPGSGTIELTATNTLPSTVFTTFNNLVISGGTTTTAAGYNLTVTGTTTIGGGTSGTLNISAYNGTKIFTGLVTINSGGTWNNSAGSPVTFRGGITNSGTFIPGSDGNQTFDTNTQSLNGNINMTGTAVTVTGINLTNNGTLTLSSNFSGTGTLTNASTGTVNSTAYITISTLTNQGTLNTSSGNLTPTTLTNTSTGFLNISGTTYTNFTTFTNQGTLNYTSSGNINSPFTNTGTVNVQGSGYIASLTNNAGGTLNISALSYNINTLIATENGNTVIYSGLGTQAIKNTTYSNLNLSGSGAKTFADATTVTGNLVMSGSATATPTATLAVSGSTTLSETSVLILGATNILSSTPIVLNGGTFRTGTGAGFGETVGTLGLTFSSIIALGTGVHSLNFANSSGVTWTSGQTLTITGWTGGYNGTSGTAGKLFVGSTLSGLTTGQLAQIQFFDGTTNFPAAILSSGEVVPLSSAISTSSISGSPFCAGSSVSVSYTKAGNFSPGNVFTAQLSNASGSFASPVNIGTLTSTTAGTIAATIPTGTLAGTGYRIRVVSSNPAVTGSDNGANSTVNALPVAPTSAATNRNDFCADDAGTISLSVTGGSGTAVRWFTGSCGGTDIGTGNPLVIASPTTSTTYYARWETASCGNSTCASVNVTVTPNSIVNVAISASVNPVCAGTSVTYTATPTNGGTSPSYQWKVNGTNVGTNSNQFTYTPADGDVVSCVMTSNAVCVEGVTTTPITYFSWNDNSKALTDSDFGLDAVSIYSGQYVSGGVSGTCLAPVSKTVLATPNILLTFDGNAPEFNTEGIDYSIGYRRDESIGEIFTRGQSLIITSGANFSVSYRVSDGAGAFTTVSSGNVYVIPGPPDVSFRNYRFRYDPTDGYGRLYVDGSQVWQSSATTGLPLYWSDAGDVIVGVETDASGNQTPTFDNLTLSAIKLKSATDQLTATVIPLPLSPTGLASQSFCSGSTVADLIATGDGILWYAASSGGSALATNTALVNGTHYFASQTVGGCESTSRFDVTATVNPNLPVSISIAAVPSGAICSGTSVTFTATPTNGGTPTYQWTVNGVNVGTNSATYSYSPANNDAITVEMTSSATCATGSPATSNTVTMSVKASPSISLDVSDANICNPASGDIPITISSAQNGVSYELQTLAGASLSPAVTGIGNGSDLNLTILEANAPIVTTTYKVVTSIAGCSAADLTDRPTVTVDNYPPIFTGCPVDITKDIDSGYCSALVNWTAPTAYDACDGVIAVSVSLGSGGTFSTGSETEASITVGETTVTYTATDAAGNIATCTFKITVKDLTAPTITCPPAKTILCVSDIPVINTLPLFIAAGGTYNDNAGSDCNMVSVSYVDGAPDGNIVTRIYTLTDGGNNTASCSQQFTISQPSVIISSSSTPCLGTGFLINSTVTTDYSGTIYYRWDRWDGSAWCEISGATGSSLNANLVSFSDKYRVRIAQSDFTSGYCDFTSNELQFVDTPPTWITTNTVTRTAFINQIVGDAYTTCSATPTTLPALELTSLDVTDLCTTNFDDLTITKTIGGNTTTGDASGISFTPGTTTAVTYTITDPQGKILTITFDVVLKPAPAPITMSYANVSGGGSGTEPNQCGDYRYFVAEDALGPEGGYTYTWEVFTGSGTSGTQLTAGTHYLIDNSTSPYHAASVKITWSGDLSPGIYTIEVIKAGSNGCDSRATLQINLQNSFNLFVNDPGNDCKAENLGTKSFDWTVGRNCGTASYSFTYVIAEGNFTNLGDAQANAIITPVTVTTTNNQTTINQVVVYSTGLNFYTTQTFTLFIYNQLDVNNQPDINSVDNYQHFILKAIPETSAISTD